MRDSKVFNAGDLLIVTISTETKCYLVIECEKTDVYGKQIIVLLPSSGLFTGNAITTDVTSFSYDGNDNFTICDGDNNRTRTVKRVRHKLASE